MASLANGDTTFGKQLAHTDKEVRDEAVEQLKRYLSREVEMEKLDMMKIWKGLFYCFWMSDKPLVQQELATSLADLALSIKGEDQWLYIRCFWETMAREWLGLDKHRLDKFYLLMRRVFYISLQALHQSNWDKDALNEFASIYQDTALSPGDYRVPDSLRCHIGDIFIDELTRLNVEINMESEDVQTIPVAAILEPAIHYMSRTKDIHIFKKLLSKIFVPLSLQAQKAETEKKPKMALNYIDRGNSETGPLNTVNFLKNAIPDIKQRLLQITEDESVFTAGRRRIATIYEKFCIDFLVEGDPDSHIKPTSLKVQTPMERKANKKAKRKKQKRAKAKSDDKEKTPGVAKEKNGSPVSSKLNKERTNVQKQKTPDTNNKPSVTKKEPTKDLSTTEDAWKISEKPKTKKRAQDADEVASQAGFQVDTIKVTPQRPNKKLSATTEPGPNRVKSKGHASPSSEKRRLKWAQDLSSVKRFRKEVPISPIATPLEQSPMPTKSALRKVSAFPDVPNLINGSPLGGNKKKSGDSLTELSKSSESNSKQAKKATKAKAKKSSPGPKKK
ncbi:hypothetical protein H4219_001508 [Mycoemilia scoparia]|uniref:Uncharacterized protein n=1 Tax=Mycoemilia scoparia TaxID=417184 RepID=A0A9W7ZZY2_9FUNG|nr:hypothetical protein H4219_001508 [Mycoemilia scoparia]